MNRSRIAAICVGLVALCVSVPPNAVLARTSGRLSHQAGPAFVFPANGQTFPYRGPYLFQVQSVSGAMGYLWTFSQNGMIAWQNLDATGRLSGATMSVKGGSGAQRHVRPGALQVRVRAEMKGGSWTNASTITVQLTGGSPSGSPTKTPSGPPAAGTVLYQANWSGGHNGWTLTQGWDTVNGELVNDGTIQDMSKIARAPQYPSATANYAVEAEIQMVRTTLSGCSGTDVDSFGFALRQDSEGYYPVGMVTDSNNWSSTIADQPWSNSCSAPLLASPLVKNSFSLDTGWHTYRAEVRGNDIRLLIDGNVADETTDNHHLHGTWAGLWSFGVVLNVRSFKVIAL